MTKQPARWVDCPGVANDGKYGHGMRDYCWNCAPWWEYLALCPNCSDPGRRLTTRGYCKGCKKHYEMEMSLSAFHSGKKVEAL